MAWSAWVYGHSRRTPTASPFARCLRRAGRPGDTDRRAHKPGRGNLAGGGSVWSAQWRGGSGLVPNATWPWLTEPALRGSGTSCSRLRLAREGSSSPI